MIHTIGIDPGITQKKPGGVAAIAPDGTAQVWVVPVDFLLIVDLLLPFQQSAVAAVEDVELWVQDCDSKAAFSIQKLIRHQERCLCALDACNIPYTLVQPAVWKRDLGLTGGGKDGSVSRAIALYPECRHLITVKSRNGRAKDMDGPAEALLMAEWLRIKQMEAVDLNQEVA